MPISERPRILAGESLEDRRLMAGSLDLDAAEQFLETTDSDLSAIVQQIKEIGGTETLSDIVSYAWDLNNDGVAAQDESQELSKQEMKDVSGYSAIVFVGGWGSSSYQYGYELPYELSPPY